MRPRSRHLPAFPRANSGTVRRQADQTARSGCFRSRTLAFRPRAAAHAGSAGAATSGVLYLAGDQQGTDTLAIDSQSMAITRRYYDPYGNPVGPAPSNPWPGNRGFAGGTADALTGLTNLGAREYDPVTGSFTSPEPVRTPYQPQDLNPYAYASDNPATDEDPTGLRPTGPNKLRLGRRLLLQRQPRSADVHFELCLEPGRQLLRRHRQLRIPADQGNSQGRLRERCSGLSAQKANMPAFGSQIIRSPAMNSTRPASSATSHG